MKKTGIQRIILKRKYRSDSQIRQTRDANHRAKLGFIRLRSRVLIEKNFRF